MASSMEFMQYVCEQLSGGGKITCKKMFGEYGIFCGGKFCGVICDDQLFLKRTEACRKLLREVIEQPPYEGASPYFLIENLDDREYLAELLQATCRELPAPKPRKEKSGLRSMPNIGPRLSEQLEQVGIYTPQQLIETGSREAWLRIKAMDDSACLNRLCALEGAIRGIRWHDLDLQTREELKAFYHQH